MQGNARSGSIFLLSFATQLLNSSCVHEKGLGMAGSASFVGVTRKGVQ